MDDGEREKEMQGGKELFGYGEREDVQEPHSKMNVNFLCSSYLLRECGSVAAELTHFRVNL